MEPVVVAAGPHPTSSPVTAAKATATGMVLRRLAMLGGALAPNPPLLLPPFGLRHLDRPHARRQKEVLPSRLPSARGSVSLAEHFPDDAPAGRRPEERSALVGGHTANWSSKTPRQVEVGVGRAFRYVRPCLSSAERVPAQASGARRRSRRRSFSGLPAPPRRTRSASRRTRRRRRERRPRHGQPRGAAVPAPRRPAFQPRRRRARRRAVTFDERRPVLRSPASPSR
jgi:hypothetical protein